MWSEIHVSPMVIAGIVVGGGVVLIILILLCIYLCFCHRDGRSRKLVQIENPSEAKGNHSWPIQNKQQRNNLPRMAEHHMLPKPSLPSRSPTHLFPQSSMSSVSSGSLPPQSLRHPPSAYKSSSNNLGNSGHESLARSLSRALSFDSSQTMFTYDDLAVATNGFSEANLLGQGGFGLVHKGVLPNGKEIAVKSLNPSSGQGNSEFRAEIDTVSRVHHKHLVSLVGFCVTGAKRLLVYEYVSNNTLEFHLHGKKQPPMDWPTRLKVAIGAAKGLAYLHEDCHPRIIHRDIKAANILLDNSFQAKVADFGLAKFTSEADTHVSTRVMGTLGYLAPEYASTGKLTDKSDVYSFGVMLLELITGRRPIDKTQKEYNLVEWARPLLTHAMEDQKFNSLVDHRLQYGYEHSEMASMVSCAANCVRKSAKLRPLMSQVVRALEGSISFSDLNEGMTPGKSLINRYESITENGGNRYQGDSRGFPSKTSEYSGSQYNSSELYGTTIEYGLYASSSSSDAQTTRELTTEEIQRENRRFRRQF